MKHVACAVVLLAACDGDSLSGIDPDSNFEPTPYELRGFGAGLRLVEGGHIAVTLGAPLQPGTDPTNAAISAAFFDPASTNVGRCTDKLAGDGCIVTRCTGLDLTMRAIDLHGGDLQATVGANPPTMMPKVDGGYSTTVTVQPNETIRITGTGNGIVPTIAVDISAPELLTVTQPTFEPGNYDFVIHRSSDFMVTWSGGTGGTINAVLLQPALPGQPNTTQLVCTFAAEAGSGALPTAALADFTKFETAQFAVSTIRESTPLDIDGRTITVSGLVFPLFARASFQ